MKAWYYLVKILRDEAQAIIGYEIIGGADFKLAAEQEDEFILTSDTQLDIERYGVEDLGSGPELVESAEKLEAKAQNTDIGLRISEMAAGRDIVAALYAMIDGKSLNNAKTAALDLVFEEIVSDLWVGRIRDSKVKLKAIDASITPDLEQVDIDSLLKVYRRRDR